MLFFNPALSRLLTAASQAHVGTACLNPIRGIQRHTRQSLLILSLGFCLGRQKDDNMRQRSTTCQNVPQRAITCPLLLSLLLRKPWVGSFGIPVRRIIIHLYTHQSTSQHITAHHSTSQHTAQSSLGSSLCIPIIAQKPILANRHPCSSMLQHCREQAQ